MKPLTRHQQALLTIAGRMHRWDARTEAPVRIYEAFGCDVIRFSQQLNDVVQLPAAEAYAPATVRRLRRRLDRRNARRAGVTP